MGYANSALASGDSFNLDVWTDTITGRRVQKIGLSDPTTGGPLTPGKTLWVPLGYQQITSLSGIQMLTVPPGALAALISVEIAGVRYRDDGTNPTASVGMPMNPTGSPLLYSGSLSLIAFTQMSSGAVLNVLYYK